MYVYVHVYICACVYIFFYIHTQGDWKVKPIMLFSYSFLVKIVVKK